MHTFLFQVNIDHQVALDVVHRLFESVAPSVFRPVDVLLKTLLAPPYDLVSPGSNTFICRTLKTLLAPPYDLVSPGSNTFICRTLKMQCF